MPNDTEETIRSHNLSVETAINNRAIRSDLFTTKEELLIAWARQKGFFSKADILNYSLRSYYLRADRTIRDLVKRGKVRKLSQGECDLRGFKGRMGYYEFVK